jgi:glycosyltransferase involved in cell wall biosynthesis
MKNSKPLLSIITPVYNGVDFVDRCYRNIRMQSFKNWEWIVVDDGSTDRTQEAVEKIKILDHRIRLFSYQTNRGRGFARTLALKESQCEWVVVWDIDDLHFPDRLDNINKARIEGYDFFCSYAVVADNDFNFKGVRGFTSAAYGLPRGFVHPTLACKTEIAQRIGYKPTFVVGEDVRIIWTLSIKYNGLWFEDTLTIYMEDREIKLQKAINCNISHLKSIMVLYKEGLLDGYKNFLLLNLKYLCKILILNLFRVKPSLYLATVKFRDYGKKKICWSLSEDRISFIEILKKGFDNYKI